MNADIIRAGIVGTAVADALGVPVEFKSRDALEQDPVVGMRAYGTHYQPAGSWSDDSSMMLATLDSLLNSCDFNDIMDKFAQWLFDGEYTPRGVVFDRGNIVQAALNRYRRGTKPLLCGGFDVRDNGNGSLMRIMPACLYALAKEARGEMTEDQSVDLMHQISSLTHAHVISQAGCGIYYFLVRALLDGQPGSLADKLQKGMDEALHHYQTRRWHAFESAFAPYARLQDLAAFAKLPEDAIQSNGYVVSTLEAALWCLLNERDYRHGMLRAVNLGSDTDTVAAVAGGLSALYYGYDAIPGEWLEVTARLDWILSLCDRAAEIW